MKDILVVDFGSRYVNDIVVCLEQRNISYSKIKWEDIEANSKENCFEGIKGIILSGSPSLDYDQNMPKIKEQLLKGNLPILGICYGIQIVAHIFGSKVAKAEKDEHALTEIKLFDSQLFDGIEKDNFVEMRHYYRVYDLPKGFTLTASTKDCPISAMENIEKKIYAVQFHPEIGGCGDKVFDNFLYKICKVERD